MGKRTIWLSGILGVMLYPLAIFSPKAGTNPNPPIDVTATDSVLFFEKQKLVREKPTIAARTLEVGKSFLGTPYVIGCLDRNPDEKLTINLRELDCWTFVENSLAISKTADSNFSAYADLLQQMRYWGGTIDGYGSRIHYFTGWLLQAEKSGLIDDITASLGGVEYPKKVGYISARPQKYPKIRDEKALKAIRNAEKRINAHKWYFIPKNRIARMEHLIQEGDIVCLTSVKADLDIAHQGFAVKINGRIHLMHASSLAKRVIIARQPLAEYVASQRGQSGIIVARLK